MIRSSTQRAICVVAATALAACATMQGSGVQQSALERSINQCLATIAIGAVLGAVINRNNRGKGALIGAGAGTVACGVLVAINNERDKERVRQAQLAALNAGTQQTQQFVGQDGNTRIVQTSVKEVPTPQPAVYTAPTSRTPAVSSDYSASAKPAAESPDRFVGPCRSAQTTITSQGQSAELPADVFCRTAAGDWKPYRG
jgi:predicted small secreted protein